MGIKWFNWGRSGPFIVDFEQIQIKIKLINLVFLLLTLNKGRVEFSQFSQKKGCGSDFSHKKGGAGQIGGVLKKRVSFIFILTNRIFHQTLVRVRVCVCVLFVNTISISVFCVSREEVSLIESNQQMYDLRKWVILENKRHCGK